jgi:hypothetical protein
MFLDLQLPTSFTTSYSVNGRVKWLEYTIRFSPFFEKLSMNCQSAMQRTDIP